jgi:nicotinamide-nucleotide amidase
MLRVAGMGESAVDEKIAPIYTKYDNPVTTILFNQCEIEIHLTARGRTEKEANELLDRLSSEIEAQLGNAIFSFAGESMEEVVGLKLSVGGYTVAVAESCTGGLLAERITDVPGSSKYFIGGVIAYANEVKTKELGVEPMLLLEHGAVSAPVAEAMAEGVRACVGTDFGLSITGIAGPDGGTEEKPVGTVFIALSDEIKTEHRRLKIPGDRNLVRWRASQAALDMLRRRLL